MTKLQALDAHAAFVDVGSEFMHVSIAGGAPKILGTIRTRCMRYVIG